MSLTNQHPNDLLLTGTILKLGLVPREVLEACLATSPPGELGEQLVRDGHLTARQLEDLRNTSPLFLDPGISNEEFERTFLMDQESDSDPAIPPSAARTEVQPVGEVTELTETEHGIDTEVMDEDKIPTQVPGKTAVRAQETIPDSDKEDEGNTTRVGGSFRGTMTSDDMTRVENVIQGISNDLTGVNLGGNYTIHGRIGSGGMGDVYRATQLSLDRQVALKVLPPRFASRSGMLQRFIDEARLLARITHSNIVQIYDVDSAAGIHFFTMEQVKGHVLKDFVDAGKELDIAILTNMLKQCIRGLNRALKEGVVHRDIKPGNILVDENGEIKIVDFGLAIPVDQIANRGKGEIVGTPLYISPEQASGRDVSFPADMYSLGATFYHLATGQPPFTGRSMTDIIDKHLHEKVPDPSLIKPELPTGFCRIITKMMAKEPAERYKSYQQLFKEIESFEIQEGIIKSESDFLSDDLLAMGDRGVSRIWAKAALMTILAVSFMMVAFGIRELVDSAGRFHLIDSTGNIGTIFLAFTYLSITYVAMARRKILPVYGNMKMWMNAHIACALISFFLVMIHSGNFFLRFLGNQIQYWHFGGESHGYRVAFLPAVNSLIFLIVIISGLVGRTLWVDLVRQVNAERIRNGQKAYSEDNRLTLTIFSQSVFKYWRILHYPMAIALLVVTVVHIVSILYWGGY